MSQKREIYSSTSFKESYILHKKFNNSTFKGNSLGNLCYGSHFYSKRVTQLKYFGEQRTYKNNTTINLSLISALH